MTSKNCHDMCFESPKCVKCVWEGWVLKVSILALNFPKMGDFQRKFCMFVKKNVYIRSQFSCRQEENSATG